MLDTPEAQQAAEQFVMLLAGIDCGLIAMVVATALAFGCLGHTMGASNTT